MAENTNSQQPDAGVECPTAGPIYTEEVAAFQQTFVRKLLAIRAWILRNRAIEKLPALGRLKLQIENVTMGEILRSAGLQMRDDWDHNLSDVEKAWLTCDLGRSYDDIRRTLLTYKEDATVTEEVVYDRDRFARMFNEHIAALDRFEAEICMESEHQQ